MDYINLRKAIGLVEDGMLQKWVKIKKYSSNTFILSIYVP